MLRKLQYICLVGSIGLVGADRIDLFAGRGPFTLTPFLVLAPLVGLIGLLRKQPDRLFRLTITPPIRRQVPFLAASSMFLLLSFASGPIGLDPERSVVAFFDLLLVSVLGYCISVQILWEPAQEKLILRSITFALIMYVIVCIGECIAWSHGLYVIDGKSTTSWVELTFAPGRLGNWVPTLSGTTWDSNRSGFILVMYLALLDRFVARSRYTHFLRWAIAILIFLTLSRSGLLCWLAYYMCSKSFWRGLASRRTVVRLALISIVSALVLLVYQKEITDLVEAWEIGDAVSTKLSMARGTSGESHVLLIQRGFDTWLTSTKTVFAGIGYAAAPKVLGDFFGNDKHGNFHDIYVTVLAEMGLPAFVILMFFLGYPIISRKGTVPCIAAIMVFNVSYQTHTEPVFWLVLALVWSYERKEKPMSRSLASAGEYPLRTARTAES
jgi:O-Antigen ligase